MAAKHVQSKTITAQTRTGDELPVTTGVTHDGLVFVQIGTGKIAYLSVEQARRVLVPQLTDDVMCAGCVLNTPRPS